MSQPAEWDDRREQFVREVQRWLDVDPDGKPGLQTWEAWAAKSAAAVKGKP